MCEYYVKIKEREKERRITQESYPGSPNPATSSPHTSCEIIHYSIQSVETSNQHYKVFDHTRSVQNTYLKMLSPTDLRSKLHSCMMKFCGRDVSKQKKLLQMQTQKDILK